MVFSVSIRGVGRKDYSIQVQRSVQPVISRRVNRITWYLYWAAPLPTLIYPNYYATTPLQFFDENNNLTETAPRVPYHIFEINASTEMNAVMFVGLMRFASMDDYLAWIMERWYGDHYGYGVAKGKYTAGLKTEPGRVYSVGFAVYSEFPAFDVKINIHAVEEDPAEYRNV